ncbi:MAG: winged helix-turn-helix domain-containing protein [Streptosporangiales bacterium]|jgi:DNA-binding transcriptional ArsR family regulator|nr:winged helix-turn-helix domain-containing protein [Streptosporangiales bacterium]
MDPSPHRPVPGTSAERTELYKTLTSPVRRQILDYIGQHREANSTSVARALGESTGTTSYHLRKLAAQHLIEEIPERSSGRERWWRLLPVEHVPAAPAERTAEEDKALSEWNSQRLSADIDLYIRAMAEYDGPGGWVQAQRTGTWMTREGVHAFYAEYLDLLREHGYPEELAPAGARPMALRFLAIPQAGPSPAGPSPS